MKHAAVLAALMTAVAPAMAQQPPEQAVTAYFAGIAASNFGAAAKCVHPAELSKIKDSVIQGLQKSVGTNEVPLYLRGFVRNDSMETLAKLSAEDVFVRLLSWFAESQPMVMANMARATVVPLGGVKEGENSHVVCRQTRQLMDTTVVNMVVVTASKDGDSWKIVPPSDVQMIARQVSGQRTMIRPSVRPSTGKTTQGPFGPIAPKVRPEGMHTQPVPVPAVPAPVAPPSGQPAPQPQPAPAAK
jgi:hypothetical protein